MKFKLFSKRSDDDFDDIDLSDEDESPSFFASLFKKRPKEDDDVGGDGDGEGDDDDDNDGDDSNDRRGWILIGGVFLVVGLLGAGIGFFFVRDTDESKRIVAPPPPSAMAVAAYPV